MAWITPSGASGWTNSSNTIDESTSTSANNSAVADGNTSNLVFTFDSISVDKIRLYNTATGVFSSKITIQYYDTSWHTAVSAQPWTRDTWEEFSMGAVRTGITSIRIYFTNNDTSTRAFYCCEAEINQFAVPTVVTNDTPTEVTTESAVLSAEVTADNDETITARGFIFKGGNIIGLMVLNDEEPFTEDTFSCDANQENLADKLEPGGAYEYRAWATNASGTGYGDWEDLTLDDGVPNVSIYPCTNIQATSIMANANITASGGDVVTRRGFCYKAGTTGDPTTSDSEVHEDDTDWGTGTYDLAISGLTPGTSYRIRAYAVGTEGTGYSETITLSDYTFTPDAETYFANFYNRCYIVNGEDRVMKYDGDLISYAGVEAPTTAPTAAGAGTDGSLGVGDYGFKYTYVDADGYESNGSDSVTEDAEATEHITVTVANSPNPNVVAKNIYRTAVDGAIYYYDGQIADNSTTTYSSKQADTTLGTAIATDHEIPPEGSQLITKHNNRLDFADDENLCISQLSDVEYVPASWFIKDGIRQDITGIIQHFDKLIVFTENSIEKLTGTDEDNWQLSNTYSNKGCYAPRSLVLCENILIWLSLDGIYYFNGESVGTFSQKLNEYIKDNVNPDYIDKAAACYWDGKYILSYPKGTYTLNTESIYIDLINQTTGVYSTSFFCFSKWDRMGDGLQLYGGSATYGNIYKCFEDNVTTDNNDFITCYDRTDFMDFGYPERWKQFYHLYIKVKTTDGTNLRFYYTLDDNDETYKDVIMTANTTRWYKVDLGGGGQRGRAIQLRPYVSDPYDITFMGYAVVFHMEAEEYS